MKNTICLIILIVLLGTCSITSGQSSAGIIGGFNSSSLELQLMEDDMTVSSRSGLAIGAFFDLKLNKTISLMFEPIYLQKYSRVNDDDSIINIEVNLSYLEIPLFLKASFGEIIQPYIYAGPTIGIRLNAGSYLNVGTSRYEGDMNDITGKMDFGIGFGTGILYKFKRFSIFLEYRFTNGTKNILKEGEMVFLHEDGSPINTVNIINNDSAKTNVKQILFGFCIPF